jgi:hypothetical protein
MVFSVSLRFLAFLFLVVAILAATWATREATGASSIGTSIYNPWDSTMGDL